MQLTLGIKALALFVLAAGGAIIFLSVINYVEHYGLVRPRLASGHHVPVSYNHSWNANHLGSNASLLRLQRHTDHHMHASKPFYRLENVEGAPRLPGNYSSMILLAMIPPLWFCVMNPRVHLYQMLSEVWEPQSGCREGHGGGDDGSHTGAAPGEPATA
jgi:alkane 1-monooxygenase